MQISCPCCHARFSVEAVVQDDAARELFALLAEHGAIVRPLFGYLGLFRSASRALAWDRTLKLAREVVALAGDAALHDALWEVVASFAEKRAQPGWKPLANHNYLKRVLESVAARGVQVERDPAAAGRRMQSKTGQALEALEGKKRGG